MSEDIKLHEILGKLEKIEEENKENTIPALKRLIDAKYNELSNCEKGNYKLTEDEKNFLEAYRSFNEVKIYFTFFKIWEVSREMKKKSGIRIKTEQIKRKLLNLMPVPDNYG